MSCKKILFLLIFLLIISQVFADTITINPSTATGTGSGSLVSTITSDDNSYYTLSKNTYVQVTGFDVSGGSGTVSSVVLHVIFKTDSGHSASNYFTYSNNNGGSWTDATSIRPNGQTTEVEQTQTLSSDIDTWSEIEAMDVYYYNNDGGSPDSVYVERIWLIVTYTPPVCGSNGCETGETYSSCPDDCCDADCTGNADSTCHSECDSYNGCAFVDATAKSVCNNQAFGTTVCYDGEATINCCESSLSTCEGCSDCSGGSCSVDDNTECSGTEASCFCSSGTCQSCSGSFYCNPTPVCQSCSLVCDNSCSDSACFGTDPDCDISGGATTECCGNSNCASGESCASDCSTETYCSDGVDNDADGFTDGVDSDCGGTETSCSDGVDNDGDGLVDCSDTSDCTSGVACASGICCSGTCSSPTCSNDAGCDDGNACTTDTCNNAGTCSSSCTNTAISACTGGDSCCPAGCNLGNDADCSATCGDSTCDAGENCANCPGDCSCGASETCCSGTCFDPCESNSDCSDSNACTSNVCNNAGTCSATCSYPAILSCINGDSCCASGCTSYNDNDCEISCGNNICESGESCSTCATDCGDCTIALGVCGNNLCEEGETYGNCRSDCNPTIINMQLVSPLDLVQRGETFSLQVFITFEEEEYYGSDALVTAESFFGNVTLNYEGLGIYSTSIFIDESIINGDYDLIIRADKETIGILNTTISVGEELDMLLETNKESIILTQVLNINSSATNSQGNIVSGDFILTILNEDEVIFSKTINNTNFFSYSYQSSTIDSPGNWLIKIEFIDEFNNHGLVNKTITASSPQPGTYYEINIINPTLDDFKRKENIQTSVNVTYLGQPVGLADVKFKDPFGNYVQMTESNIVGVYTATYQIPNNAPLGSWDLLFYASKDLQGFSRKIINIESASINLEVSGLDRTSYQLGETVRLTIRAFYSDGSPVSVPIISTIINNETVELERISDGVYSLDYVVNQEGSFEIITSVSDSDNNLGSSEINVIVSGTNFMHYIRQYPYIFYPLVIIIIGGIGFASYKLTQKTSISSLKKQKKLLTNQIKKLQDDYYNKASITKKIFESETNDREKQIKILNEKIKNLKKK